MLTEIHEKKNNSSSSDEESPEKTLATLESNNEEQIDEEAVVPSFGNVTIDESNEVHFGNRTVYHGPVEIKQILYTKKSDNEANNSAFVINNQIQTNQNVSNNLHNCIISDDRDVGVTITNKSNCTVENDNSATFNGANNKNNDVFNNQTTQKNNNSNSSGAGSFLKGLHSKKKIILCSLFAAILVILVILILLLTLPISSPQELVFVSREEWKAKPPKAALTQLPTLPVVYIIIQHTATENCSTEAECILHTQKIQEFHMGGRGWDDIGYNFLVGGDGRVYEARGWKTQGAHTLGYNAVSLGIAFIGTFNTVRPAEVQLKSCKKLIEFGVKQKYVIDEYKLLGARQLHTTQSPGNELYREIKTWSHWVAAP